MCAARDDKLDDKRRYNHEECHTNSSVFKDSEHIKTIAENDGSLTSVSEFCGAFYHVPEERELGIHMFCLDRKNCHMFRDKSISNNPRTAVALVKYNIEGKSTYFKRYTNCYQYKVHAEEYFKHDVDNQINDGSLPETAKGVLTMYITMQPCHKSTDTQGTTKDYSCCNILKELMDKLLPNVTLRIKPTHLLKAGWKKQENPKYNEHIENAEEGLKELMRHERIEFSEMTPDDWNYLWKQTKAPKDYTLKIVEERKALDVDIRDKLEKWGRNEVEDLTTKTKVLGISNE